MIDLIIPIYKRYGRFKDLLDQLKKQTNQNFNLNIWNNSGQILDIGDFPKERVLIVRSPRNISAGDRWKLIPLTKGNPIISIDDDEELAPDFIEYNYQEYLKWGKKSILGWYSKTWEEGNTDYTKDKGFILPYGTEVDYVGAGGMCGDREFFSHKLVVDNDIFYDYYQSEDIFISYFARKQGYKIISILPKCKIIQDDFGTYRSTKHLKKEAYKLLLKAGWQFYGGKQTN